MMLIISVCAGCLCAAVLAAAAIACWHAAYTNEP